MYKLKLFFITWGNLVAILLLRKKSIKYEARSIYSLRVFAREIVRRKWHHPYKLLVDLRAIH